jgi:hypothetical protein
MRRTCVFEFDWVCDSMIVLWFRGVALRSQAIVLHHGVSITAAMFQAVMKEAASVIGEDDLHLSHLALLLLAHCTHANRAVLSSVRADVMPKVHRPLTFRFDGPFVSDWPCAQVVSFASNTLTEPT